MTINSRNQLSFFFLNLIKLDMLTLWSCLRNNVNMKMYSSMVRPLVVKLFWLIRIKERLLSNLFFVLSLWLKIYNLKKLCWVSSIIRICFVLEPIGSNKVLEVTLLTKMFWSKLCPLVRKVFRLRVKRHWKVKIFARIKERILSMKVNSFFVLWLKFLQFFVG